MKRTLPPYVRPLALVAGILFACNTAQVTQPPLVDAGPACPTLAPSLTDCDAGAPPSCNGSSTTDCDAGVVSASSCSGGVTLALDSADSPDASNTIPVGSYPLNCRIQFFVPDPASATCLRAEPCTCTAPGSASDAGDAGAGTPTWQCFPTQ